MRRGEYSERFELRDGDCGGSDCGNPRYRAEISLSTENRAPRVGEDTWYGWSFYNVTVPRFARQDSLRLVFGQWTMGGGATPVMRLIQLGQGEGNWSDCNRAVCSGPELYEGDIALQLEDMSRTLKWGSAENDGYVCRLFDMQDMQRKWVDLVVNTNFSTGLDGYVRVWVNDELKCDYKGPIVSVDSLAESDRVGHRRGIFSSYTRRWTQSRGAEPKPTFIVYYDEFRQAKARADVDVAFREVAGRPVVD